MAQLHRLKTQFQKGTSTISMRLRLVFMMIGLVTAGAGIVALSHARVILSAHTELNQTALPMLALAQRTERDLNAMFLVLENIDSYQTNAKIKAARSEITNKTERVRQNLSALQAFNVPKSMTAVLDARLGEAMASSLVVLDHHSAFFALQDKVNETRTRLRTLHENSQRVLDQLSFEITSQIETLIHTENSPRQSPEHLQYDHVNALFIASMNISNIGHGLDGIISLINNPGLPENTEKADRARLLITAKIQNLINRLSQLPTGPSRRDLARNVAEIRNLLATEGDFFAQMRSQHQFQQEFESNRAAHFPFMVGISNMSSTLVKRILATVESTSQKLNTAVYNLIWVLAAAFLTALITIVFANQRIIERQFTARIKALNSSVSAIAKGDLDHPITITGTDELGDMARALAVFKQTAEDLQSSNVELEKFAYVAAHDLRSPLRAIHDLSAWTIEDEENVLSGESQAYLTLLQSRVVRLNKLLKDLLAYARVGQDAPRAENIQLAQLVQEQAQYADPENVYRIQYLGDPIEVFIQRTPIQQIIGNLLNNAVKHHDRAQGSITVSAMGVGTSLILTIADDGPGIEPRYQKQIFDLFQTLRPRDEVEASGLGLAIVKKLVSRQKGNITLISDPAKQRGAIFKVTLPLSHPAQTADQYRSSAAA